jgi:hypothetical protein
MEYPAFMEKAREGFLFCYSISKSVFVKSSFQQFKCWMNEDARNQKVQSMSLIFGGAAFPAYNAA